MKRIALILLACATGTAHAATWTVDPAASTLVFRGKYEGEPFQGRFRKFGVSTLAFDAKDPAQIKIVVDVDMASVDTGNEDRDGTLRTPDFLWWEKYPKARFETTACRAGATVAGARELATTQHFTCAAKLTIREKTQAFDFPFTWTTNADGTATLAAKVTLDRTQYGVGRGDWADDALIAHAVDVTTKLKLKLPVP